MKTSGVRQILLYNFPMYLSSAGILIGSLCLYLILPQRSLSTRVLLIGVFLVAFWTLSSLFVSHWIYDRSELYRWGWLARRFALPPDRWIVIHAGLDEVTPPIRRLFPQKQGVALDVYDPQEMPERSISRARKHQSPSKSVKADLHRIPLQNQSVSAVFLIFMIHEIRASDARIALFSEINRILSRCGQVIIVEHARDTLNFLAYGPGFLHFLPSRAWLTPAQLVGLRVRECVSFTPFVKAYFLQRM